MDEIRTGSCSVTGSDINDTEHSGPVTIVG
jgi:hypothetical protein